MASPTGFSRVPGIELSLDGWAALPKDEKGEFVDGRIEQEEVADAIHQLAVLWLGSLLVRWLRGRGGFVLGSDAKLAVTASRGLAATSGTVSQVPGCPGLTLDLDDLWAEIGRLGPESP